MSVVVGRPLSGMLKNAVLFSRSDTAIAAIWDRYPAMTVGWVPGGKREPWSWDSRREDISPGRDEMTGKGSQGPTLPLAREYGPDRFAAQSVSAQARKDEF